MKTCELKCFTQPEVLYQIGTELLDELLNRFKTDLDARKVVIPNPMLPDTEYYESVAELFKAPSALPEQLVEAVQAVEELASPESKSRLETAFSDSPLELYIDPDASPEHTALKIWLNFPYQRIQPAAAPEPPPVMPAPPVIAEPQPAVADSSLPAVVAHSELTAPQSNVPPSTLNPQRSTNTHSPKYTRRRTGKVACLPKDLRDRINEMISDGLTYLAIIKALGDDGKELNEDNVSNWRLGGYKEWVTEQNDREQMGLWEEYTMELVKQNEHSALNEATIKMATAHIRKALRAVGHANLEAALQDHPESHIRLLNSLSRLTSGAMTCQNYRLKAEQHEADTQRQAADPDSLCITAESLRKIEELLRLR